MRPRNSWFVAAAILFLLAVSGPVHAGDKAPDKKEKDDKSSAQDLTLDEELDSDLSLKELDRMESRIKVLQKKIKIQELRNKLKEKKSEDKSEKSENKKEDVDKKSPKKLLKKLSRKKGNGIPPGKDGPSGGKPGTRVPGMKAGKGDPTDSPFPRPSAMPRGSYSGNDQVAADRARVTSISGFAGEVTVKIQLPKGGKAAVNEGDETRIGTVESISLDKVIVEAEGEKHRVPFANKMGEGGGVPSLPSTGKPDPSGPSVPDSAAAGPTPMPN